MDEEGKSGSSRVARFNPMPPDERKRRLAEMRAGREAQEADSLFTARGGVSGQVSHQVPEMAQSHTKPIPPRKPAKPEAYVWPSKPAPSAPPRNPNQPTTPMKPVKPAYPSRYGEEIARDLFSESRPFICPRSLMLGTALGAGTMGGVWFGVTQFDDSPSPDSDKVDGSHLLLTEEELAQREAEKQAALDSVRKVREVEATEEPPEEPSIWGPIAPEGTTGLTYNTDGWEKVKYEDCPAKGHTEWFRRQDGAAAFMIICENAKVEKRCSFAEEGLEKPVWGTTNEGRNMMLPNYPGILSRSPRLQCQTAVNGAFQLIIRED